MRSNELRKIRAPVTATNSSLAKIFRYLTASTNKMSFGAREPAPKPGKRVRREIELGAQLFDLLSTVRDAGTRELVTVISSEISGAVSQKTNIAEP